VDLVLLSQIKIYEGEGQFQYILEKLAIGFVVNRARRKRAVFTIMHEKYVVN
jgi:hypothetical protein